MSETTQPTPSWARRIELGVLTALGLAATGIMFANAVLRYVLGSTLIWAEEVIRILFVWAMFVAITGAFFRNEHIGFDNLVKKAPWRQVHEVVYGLCLLVVGAILAFEGYRYEALTGDVGLPATNLPSSLLMWPGILAGALWALLGLYRLARLVPEALGRRPS